MTTLTPTPFIVRPDGAEPIVERLEWLTNLETARSGKERRAPRRAHPRFTLSARFTMLSRTADSILNPVRGGGPLLVPAWMHPLEKRDGLLYVDGIAPTDTASAPFFLRSTTGELTQVTTSVWADGRVDVSNADSYPEAWPAIAGRLTDGSFSLEYATPTARSTSLSFMSTDVLEHPGPWTGATENGLPVFPSRHDWTNRVTDGTAFTASSFDAGHLTSWELHYSKRTVGVLVTLNTRAAILNFRRFLYAVQGRYGAFRFKAPQDTETSTWRLASDLVELQYYRPGLARVELQFVEIKE